MWLQYKSWMLILLIAIHFALSEKDVQSEKRDSLKSSDGNVMGQQETEYEEGFERLSDVKEFQPIGADGRHIEPEEYGAQFSIIVPARQEVCFFQPAKKGSILQVQFQVESGGEEDIDLIVYDAKENVVMRELGSSGNMDHKDDHDDEQHEGSSVKVYEAGHYKICLSNRFSMVTSKRVYMDVGPVLSVKYKTLPDKDLATRDIESMSESMDNIQGDLDTVIGLQLMQKKKHRKHMNLALDNNLLVVWRSIITVLLMVGSVSLQTYFIRQLFKTPTKA